jgi:hypothetical protein
LFLIYALSPDSNRNLLLINESNKALQLTPSRTAPVSYDRSAFPFTSFLELVRPFGVAELGVRS